ncbi:MAG TPA: aromatic hydrocarbon degradation protein, partial [Puia sp.]
NYLGLRLGGEMKFNTLFARLGGAYYTNPYQDSKELKVNKLFLTAGGGWRNAGMFIDLAFVAGFFKDVNFPYVLSDKNNVVAALKQFSGTGIVTVGFKF